MCSATRRTLRNAAAAMLFVLLCLQNVAQVLSEATLPPPTNIQVDKWQLRWSPATEEKDIMYTVHYRSYDTNEWKVVPACDRIAFNSCDVASTKAKDEHGCVMLRVVAERHGLTSVPVKACSRHGDSCTPDFNLTAWPGSLTVYLNDDHHLTSEHAGNAKHRIFFGKQGEQLRKYSKDVASSETISELEEGQTYCVQVQYVVMNKLAGLASCIQCELIPKSGDSTQTLIIVSVLVVLVLVAVIPGAAYILIFHRKKIKRCLEPPYRMPNMFLEPLHIPVPTRSPSDEHCDVISSVTPEEF